MHVDEAVLAPVRARYGEPAVVAWEGEVAPDDIVVVAAERSWRRHDVTFFVFDGDRLAFIRKPSYPPGIWRPPSGGVNPGERFEAGVAREALEELGVEIELERYLVRMEARFHSPRGTIEWRTHVFSAVAAQEELGPRDPIEIEAARWGTLAELSGPLRERILATGRPLWRYRVALHDAAAATLTA